VFFKTISRIKILHHPVKGVGVVGKGDLIDLGDPLLPIPGKKPVLRRIVSVPSG